MNKIDWKRIEEMYSVVKSGIVGRADNKINGHKISVYSMGKNNPTIRIDIKEDK